MLNADNSHFTLTEDGRICFQPLVNNPLPGTLVARVVKGSTQLQPEIELLEKALPSDVDRAAAADKLKAWLAFHIDAVLEPLVPLYNDSEPEGAARDIASRLHDALGILPREQLEDLIVGLDEAGRASLRQRRVRMGPVLVFLPALNKPAAVRLRALLWSLWHDKTLPAQVPPDGMTSLALGEQGDTDAAYYRAIGYPVYGGRAIRVDMLDRLICAVYDSASEGKFKARHEMAEWLGCPIADLYKILEAMGHKKIYDPAEETVEKEATEDAAPPEENAKPAAEHEPEPEQKAAPDTPLQPKPELATFSLRRGKAYDSRRPKAAAKDSGEKAERKDRPRRKPVKKQDKKPGKPQNRPQVLSAGAQTKADSPFAVLKQLQQGDK